ncbi:XRE family transcriptional regulator [Herminiimonas sp. CN]|uniref:LexA family transcriptional regulator n=1 Tax=Herminiimonas sp. CN TaxID=1349818 RepID=UPI000473FE7F|nr:XRE family transcriptional regulator [Herminiimonas sp. CN]
MSNTPKTLEQWQIEDAKRLKDLFAKRAPKITQVEFGEKFDIGSQGMVWQYTAGRRPLNIKAAAAFARGLNVNIESFSPTLAAQIGNAAKLMGTEGDSVTPDQTTKINIGYVRFPVLDAPHGLGGNLAPSDHPEILQYVEVSEDWARRTLNHNFTHIKIVPCIGDSMTGTIEDGSVVFIDTSTRHFAGDGLYSIIWQGRLQIKRLQARHEEKRLRIISDNKLYDPDWATDDLIISGRVLAAWNFRRF